jgi:hypothetical protein
MEIQRVKIHAVTKKMEIHALERRGLMGPDHIAPIGCLGIGIRRASIDVRPALNQSGGGPEFGDDESETSKLGSVIRELWVSSLTTPVARGHMPPAQINQNLAIQASRSTNGA